MGRVQEDHCYLQQEILTTSKSAWVKGRSYYGNTQAIGIGQSDRSGQLWSRPRVTWQLQEEGFVKEVSQLPSPPSLPPSLRCLASSPCQPNTTRNQGTGSLLDASGPYKRQRRAEERGEWIWEESIQFPGEIVIKK